MNFCSYLEIDFPDIALSQTAQHCLFIFLSKERNTEVHKSQISRGVLVNCAEPMALPGRVEIHLPGVLLWLGKEGG